MAETRRVVIEGTIRSLNEDDGGIVLSGEIEADSIQGTEEIFLVTFRSIDEADEPQHILLPQLQGKQLRVTIEVLG